MTGVVGSWLRKHPRVVDTAVATAVFLYNLPIQGGYVPEGLPPGTGISLSFGLCAPYVVRRAFPIPSFGAIGSAFLVQLALGIEILPANVMLYFGLYNVAVCCRRWVSLPAAGGMVLCALLAAARWESPYLTIGDLLTALVLIASVWMWGSTIGIRRAHVAGLRERAEQLEKERDSQARIAAAEERVRITREIHDTVSHGLSAVVVLAQSIPLSVRGDPDRAEEVSRTVERTGRSALVEMRRMLDVLRDAEPGVQPGVAQLERLVADARAAELPVELAVRGIPQALPTRMDLAVYRIVQEALTNARKHAGSDVTRVDVALCYGDEDVQLRVSDDGGGVSPDSRDPLVGGHGLVGMRERTAACGGVLRSGSRADGGFEVAATFPLGRES